jgi:hypothetical protein
MLTVQELNEMKTYVLHELPHILEADPQFVLFIEGIINEKFPRRDEFARLLDEFTSFRKETQSNFEHVDYRFEQVDQRIDHVAEEVANLRQEVKQDIGDLRQEVKQDIGNLRQEVKQDIGDLRQEVKQDIGDLRQEVKQDIGDLQQGLTGEMRNLRDWVEVIAGGLQHRAGRNLENIVAGALRLGLQRPDIAPEHIKLRQKIVDPEGLVFKAGKQKEVDIVVQNGELLVFEVKSAPDADDVDEFADKVALVRLQNPDKQVSGVFVAVGVQDDVKQRCFERSLRLIPS